MASKVVGKVAWIGVEKGDRVTQGQVIARLEDDEYRAQLQQAQGRLTTLEARLLELQNGSRPEEIDFARANVDRERADLANAKVSLDRIERLLKAQDIAQQEYDNAKARYDAQAARVASMEKMYQLAKLGPRQEQIAQARGEIEQAKGTVALAETQLNNTIIRAPIRGTILERIVERGEFVTTGFVGDRGAKGYVVSMADLDDLQVELDINQLDFAKLAPRQRGTIRTDAYRDRTYQGFIEEIAPEANRQKATVQVKVKVTDDDGAATTKTFVITVSPPASNHDDCLPDIDFETSSNGAPLTSGARSMRNPDSLLERSAHEMLILAVLPATLDAPALAAAATTVPGVAGVDSGGTLYMTAWGTSSCGMCGLLQ